jgi:hypothetical protein
MTKWLITAFLQFESLPVFCCDLCNDGGRVRQYNGQQCKEPTCKYPKQAVDLPQETGAREGMRDEHEETVWKGFLTGPST